MAKPQTPQEMREERKQGALSCTVMLVLVGLIGYGVYWFLNREAAVEPATPAASVDMGDSSDPNRLVSPESQDEGILTPAELADADALRVDRMEYAFGPVTDEQPAAALAFATLNDTFHLRDAVWNNDQLVLVLPTGVLDQVRYSRVIGALCDHVARSPEAWADKQVLDVFVMNATADQGLVWSGDLQQCTPALWSANSEEGAMYRKSHTRAVSCPSDLSSCLGR